MVPGNCQRGQLTKRGAEQHLALGRAFRDVYIKKQHLLPGRFDPTLVYLRSTDVPRTLQSAMNFVSGAFPGTLAHVIPIATMERDTETADPSGKFCPALNHQRLIFKQSGAYRNYRRSRLKPLVQKYAALWNVSSINTNALNDELRGHFCHGLPRPIVQLDDALRIETATRHLKNLLTLNTLRLYVGFFLGDIMDTLLDQTRRFNLLSAHDTTVRALLLALVYGDAPQMRWPAYASHLAFERWRDPSGKQFVVLQYDGTNKRMRGPCKNIWCQFSDFRGLVAQFNVTRRECFSIPSNNLINGSIYEFEPI